MPALGERFRAAREARGLSLSDVSEQIRIRSVYLAAIEEENWSAIGAPVYVRGFLRTYARFLGLDPEEVVGTFNVVPAAGNGPKAGAPESASYARAGASPEITASEHRTPRGPVLVWVAGLVAALLVAFVIYNEVTMHRNVASTASNAVTISAMSPSAVASAAAVAEASPGPSPTAGATVPPGYTCPSPGAVLPGEMRASVPSACPGFSPAPGFDGPNSLALVLSAPSWLRVTVDGSVSMEGTFPAGTSKSFHGKNALVRIGNAGGVEIYVDGKDVGKLGKSGDVAERSFTL